MRIFTNPNFDFIRWRWHALAVSLLIIAGGAAAMAVGGVPLGIDFSGGTLIIVQFDRVPTEQLVRGAVGGAISGGGDVVVQRYGEPERRQILIRVPQVGAEAGGSLSQTADAVVAALKGATLGNFTVVGSEIVGPVIGADLQRKGIYATLASILGITIYIALRFRPSFALGAIAATFHDILVTLAFLTFFGYELSLNVVAAILTITGYSVNDTIVVFDRVRENMRFMRRDALRDIINTSVNQTLARTVITAGTTFVAVLSLFLFGGEVLRGFAFTMLVGIISGTYSTIFIASAIAIILSRGRAAARAATVAAPPPARRTKARNARAS